ncbi:hypothetical protein KNE206_72750 [Kitasatospora sp. NE20-6]|uniref:hypothetical protein n=1 Tax=Kitasatospora sp. NE20-6 TaxID=2859066 RepID=UPI0034DC95CA
MATNQKFNGFNVNRSMLVTGAVLTGFGAVLSLTGAAILAATLASAGRDWMQQLDTPPSERAARAVNQARAASLAGMEAWRSQGRASSN